MPLELCPEERVFLNCVRNFVQEEVLPNSRQWEQETAFPDHIWPQLGELGPPCLTWCRRV